jgi:hypothetical protein
MRVTLITAALSIASYGPAAQRAGIHEVAWLEGCWEMSSAGRTVEERWTPPRGDSMLGMSRTIRDGTLVEYEFIVLRQKGDRLAYVAHPSGQKPATFLSTRIDASEIVFENPSHDFPKVIGYRLQGKALTAWVSGGSRRVEFPYVRVNCSR